MIPVSLEGTVLLDVALTAEAIHVTILRDTVMMGVMQDGQVQIVHRVQYIYGITRVDYPVQFISIMLIEFRNVSPFEIRFTNANLILFSLFCWLFTVAISGIWSG